MEPSNDDKVLLDVYRKLEREKHIIQGTRTVRQSTTNVAVQQRCDTTIREAEKNISYLEETMRQLKLRKNPGTGGSSTASGQSSTTPTLHHHNVSNASTVSSMSSSASLPPVPPKEGLTSSPSETTLSRADPKPRPNFTRLDLIKYDTPYLGPRIQLMLQQLEFKLSVEQQYKQGIEKMLKLYQIEGDRRSKTEAENKRNESTQKIQLLKKALKRYSDMHVDIEEDLADDDDSIAAGNIRRNLTGNLYIACYGIKDVDHVAPGRFAKVPESVVTFKVEDQTRAKTKFSRNERWAEDFDIPVDKASEIEIVVYDRSGDHDVPVGLMWLRITDIAEALRRKKLEHEMSRAGWVSASKVQSGNGLDDMNQSYASNGSYTNQSNQTSYQGSQTGGQLGVGGPGADGLDGREPADGPMTIDSWFVLEPAGQIHLVLGFEKSNRVKRAYDHVGGLGRQGAIRQKKEEVHEVHGHKFVPQQFYNIMRCALCGDFLKYSAGYQCQDCRYTCHKKCYPKVVTKCISKASTEADPDEEKLNHRIPHRFEPTTNMSANWCCHCGYILPLGKKNVRKCTECGLTCHPDCAYLVPDFCGMSMEMANQILSEIKSTKIRKQAIVSMISSPERKQQIAPSQAIQSGTTTQQQRIVSPYHTTPYQIPQQPTSPVYGQPPLPPKKEPIKRKEVGSGAQTTGQPGSGHSPTQFPTQPIVQGLRLPQQTQQQLQQPLPSIPSQPTQVDARGTADHGVGSKAAATAAAGAAMKGQQQQQQQPTRDGDGQYKTAERPTSAYSAIIGGGEVQVQVIKKPKRKVGLDDFNFLAVLGKGNFGKVMLAESKNTKQLYAIKVLKKDFIIENDEVESIRSEKRVFLVANREKHPFLLNLHSCFQTENRIYFVMEYISGGDLMWHIQKELFTPRRAQFYAAEVLLALKYFHDNGVIYRDLKLDNILLTLQGHIKIGDYGLCKEDMWYGKTTGTFCGTPEFMAPEILLEQKYGRAVDWWAFGVLLYQMLLGKSPFRGDDDDEVFDAILSDEPLYPIHMPRDSVSILQELLTRDPTKRLGSGPRDAEEIMNHAYFKNINFDDIYNCRVQPPFIPKIDSPIDVQNFDSEFTSEPPALTPVTTTLIPHMQEQFRGFSYLSSTVI